MVNNAYDKYKNLTIQTKEAINHNISKKIFSKLILTLEVLLFL